MAVEDKPYRVYRGGRAKGKVPLERSAGPEPRSAPAPDARPRRRRIWLWIVLALVGVLVLALAWGVLGFVSFSNGVEEANARLPGRATAQLAPHDGSLLSDPATILVVGTDGGKAPGRGDANRSDSLLLLRTDPGTHRLSYLSIPRDLRVEIPGYGTAKINAANQYGGPALTLETVHALTGLDIDHVVVVNFDAFRDLIDALGGIDITVPAPLLSKPFDCPYSKERCRDWEGWRFAKGNQHMDGRRALAYSRIRVNELDPSETDVQRTERQQAVADAVGDKLSRPSMFFRLPFVGDSLAAPLTTDLSAWQLGQLGWVRFRAGASLRCKLGGDPATIGGESVILGSEDNARVIAMFLGRSAPLAPPKGAPYAPGCRRR